MIPPLKGQSDVCAVRLHCYFLISYKKSPLMRKVFDDKAQTLAVGFHRKGFEIPVDV